MHYFSDLFDKVLYMFRQSQTNKKQKYINIGTPKKNCIRPTRQYGIKNVQRKTANT
jgi:hypothetical protein